MLRKVALQPIILPSRSLKFAIDFLAFVIEGCCCVNSFVTSNGGRILLAFILASLTPIFTTILFIVAP